jgi:RNA:NAD 2'-phosphotransferase (TPT1/KptA family)
MARNHIHMAIGLPGKEGVISGMRYSCDAVFEINILKAVMSSSIPFYKSSNDVILTPGVGEKGMLPSKYFRSAFNPLDRKYFYMAPIKYLCIVDFNFTN